MTLAILRISGNIPTSKQRFTNLDNHTEKNSLKLFKRKTGTLLGPVDFFTSKAFIISSTSSGTVGARKKEELLELINYLPLLSFLFK